MFLQKVKAEVSLMIYIISADKMAPRPVLVGKYYTVYFTYAHKSTYVHILCVHSAAPQSGQVNQ